jgi:hypothetical protein
LIFDGIPTDHGKTTEYGGVGSSPSIAGFVFVFGKFTDRDRRVLYQSELMKSRLSCFTI